MTVRDLYNWAKENDALDKNILTIDGERGGYCWFDYAEKEGSDSILLKEDYNN